MSDFGDTEPEDSWHPDDPVAVLVDNLRRRLVVILARGLGEASVAARLDGLADDLAHIAARIRAGRIGSQHG